MSTDPYAPPATRIDDAPEGDDPRKRPVLVWIICIVNVFGIVGGLVVMAMVVTRSLPMPPEVQAVYDRMGVLDYAVTLVQSALQLVASVLLFRLKARAPDVLLASFVLYLLWNVYQYFASPLFGAVIANSWGGTISGFAISVAILLYAYRLRRRGILR